MLKDARRSGALTVNVFDRDLFDPLPETDRRDSIDPYNPEERERILEGFRQKRPFYYALVYHQFWTGCRPSETFYLRRRHVDLRYGSERIEGNRVNGNEGGTKTKGSNRHVQLRDELVDVMKEHLRFDPTAEWLSTPAADPDDYVFTTPGGAPIDEVNFYSREWLPMIRWLRIRPRPFYNTRHSNISFMLSCGSAPLFVSSQSGTRSRPWAKTTPNICRKWT